MARLYNGAERPNRCVYCYTNHKPSAFCLLLYLEFGNKDGHGKLAAEQTAFTVSYG
ncbi:MAG: hypothetical protein RIG63_01645 [Coleofasciculus chthonoplastes F3-SA18-01]|jgi:hypothetical protein|uniref:hypothetical protein n=1 Tax=Coleofasciculus chthonoplastes TaxID=64178 RepID=UPI0032FB8A46